MPTPGTLLANRFQIQRLAGRGGMGSVYRAVDTTSGQPVALKLLNTSGDSETARRFTREARLLAELRHPRIVSYVAHGVTQEGQPFLAMEWLEGEDLAQRLVRQPLCLSESLLLVRSIAEGLASAHARGIVHRDIKPSNLFLRGGRVEDVVVLDFGLARLAAASQVITGSETVLGTPGYMAPEQASSNEEITPGADIFSLGCVLYECLAGQPPFRAPHMASVLAKILFSEPPRLRTLRPELPASVQDLTSRMLDKNPARRLEDGSALLRALETLGPTAEVPAPHPPRAPLPTRLTQAEQQLVSVLLATPYGAAANAPTLNTEDAEHARGRLGPLLQELRANGARATLLADGSLLATFILERGAATDQAALAAHCALSVKARWPESLVVLATGLTLRGESLPVGEVMDRAGEFLRKLERDRPDGTLVVLDDTTAGLLGPRFQLDKTPSGTTLLLGEQLSVDESRPLLGRPTPCVGREQELAMLEMAFLSCVEDTSARAVLVTATPGTGKSRLRHEFLRRLEHRGETLLVMMGRGDPMNAGSPHGLLGEAVRRLCGVLDGEPLESRREKLARRLSQSLPPDATKDTVEFLGELCGVPFPLEDSPKLRAAREDPKLMSTQVTRALLTFLRSELSQGPVLLVLEDLHWSDAFTVKLVDEVLRELSEQSLMVLALARPEVKELFPQLWTQHLQEVPLRGLSQKASTRLIREVLGAQVEPAVVSRLVEQAAGNALFLEELIRNEAEGRGTETPGTVLAILQSRLQRLEPTPRRVLQAASIFGRSFWSRGVQALLEDQPPEGLEQALRGLSDLEMVQRQAGSRFPDETEYRFRHALVKDAAYSLVPDSLKPLGHRRAGAWLERAGEQDPWVLAEHYQLGQEKERAVHFFTRAGERLFEQQDTPGALRCLETAMACEPTGATLAELRALEVMICFWREDFERGFVVGTQVQPQLTRGSAPWARVTGAMILMGAQSGRHAEVAQLAGLLLSTDPAPEAIPSYVETASLLTAINSWFGLRPQALGVLARMNAIGTAVLDQDHSARGWSRCARAWAHYFLQPQPWQASLAGEDGVRAFREVNSDRNRTAPQAIWGLAMEALGDRARAIELLRDAAETSQRGGETYAAAATQMELLFGLSNSPEPSHQEESRHLAHRILASPKGDRLHLGIAHLALGRVTAAAGRYTEAETHARQACEYCGGFLSFQSFAHTFLSATLRAQGRAAEARTAAEAAVQVQEQIGGAGAGSVGAWLALAEACLAQGDTAEGERALRQAVQYAQLRAEDIPDAEARERFLRQVPENARALELARERWGADWERRALT